jgi:NADH-quinone oxidoreductase subunit J
MIYTNLQLTTHKKMMLLIAISSILILWVKNPMHAVLGLILLFINSAILLVSLKINFIALTYVVVYIGAICVLFLFVIMLLNLRSAELANRASYKKELISYGFVLTIFLLVQALSIQNATLNQFTGETIAAQNATSFVALYLLEHPEQFLLLTMLLLIAIVAPIAIATSFKSTSKRQDLFDAFTRELNTVSLLSNSK